MTRPNGMPLEIVSQTSTTRTGDETETSAARPPLTTSRMVDWSLGIELTYDEELLVSGAFATMLDNDQSLNQSLAYISDTPLCFHLEVKKPQSDRDPTVQLAVWVAGQLEKQKLHGWDTTVAMPGITVSGHDWKYFLFFERLGNLVSGLNN